MHLIPCSACRRHVRSGESRCPFCHATRTPGAARALDPSTRLGRAALFAFRATTAVALTTMSACGDDAVSAPPTTLAPPSGSGPQIPPSGATLPPPETTIMAPYGAPPEPRPEPPPPTTTTDEPATSGPVHHHRPVPADHGVHALYGGPGLE